MEEDMSNVAYCQAASSPRKLTTRSSRPTAPWRPAWTPFLSCCRRRQLSASV